MWPFAVWYAAHQLNLRPRVCVPETSPTVRWTGEVGNVWAFWGALSLVRDTFAAKLFPRTLRCIFLGFPTDAPPWQFYHPALRCVLSSQDVTFDEATGAGGARAGGARGTGAAGAGGAGAASAGGARGGGARGTGAAGARGASAGGAGGIRAAAAGARGTAAAGAGGTAAAGAGGAGAGGTGGSGAGGTGGTGGTGAGGVGGAGAADGTGSSAELHEPKSCPASPVRTVGRGRRSRLPPVPGTHTMALRPSSVPQRVALPSPPASSPPDVPGPESDLARAASPTVTSLLATVVTDPFFESTAAFALVTKQVDFAATRPLDCASFYRVWFELECLAAVLTHFASMMLCLEGDPDALDIPTPRSFAEAITGFSQRQGVDFFQTFSPTPKMTTLWVLLHGAAQRDYELHSLDFSSAFLQSSLHEEIWLRRPHGFTGASQCGGVSEVHWRSPIDPREGLHARWPGGLWAHSPAALTRIPFATLDHSAAFCFGHLPLLPVVLSILSPSPPPPPHPVVLFVLLSLPVLLSVLLSPPVLLSVLLSLPIHLSVLLSLPVLLSVLLSPPVLLSVLLSLPVLLSVLFSLPILLSVLLSLPILLSVLLPFPSFSPFASPCPS
ncbi:unnamed protein product [Closterium sp. NIES-53]